jgi:hypothetical protein
MVNSEPEAEIVQSLLNSRGVETAVDGQIALSAEPFSKDGLGEIDILVKEEDAEKALEIIQEHIEEDFEEDVERDIEENIEGNLEEG